ncbi:hypothetical protein JHK84_035738 [Glycine max]|nr:hypothetical protein JHK84_035738 [Glycine max]
MEAILVDCAQKSLRHFMHSNAIFISQRLCAQFPSEISRKTKDGPSRLLPWTVMGGTSVGLPIGLGQTIDNSSNAKSVRCRRLFGQKVQHEAVFADF